MKFKDGKTFSAYVGSKLHSGYITLSGMQNTNPVCMQITVKAYLFPLEDGG